MLVVLLIIMALVAVIQPSNDRKILAGAFVGITILYGVFSIGLSGDGYYLLASSIDLMIIIAMTKLKESWLSVGLSQVCLFSMLANFIGWIFWYNSLYPVVYEILFILIYSYAILVMLRTERNVGNNKNNLNYYWFHTAFTERLQFIFKSPSKT